jgi:predicted DNA-binding mobile mystery protein A
MQPIRSVTRRQLDERLAGLGELMGPPPARGWIRAVRDALAMSLFELGQRMGVSASNVSQLERAEATGSIQLASLERAARGLNCRLWYVLVPDEPLEQMVRRQALAAAAAAVAEESSGDDRWEADAALLAAVRAEQVEALAYELIDSPGLWRMGPESRNEPA